MWVVIAAVILLVLGVGLAVEEWMTNHWVQRQIEASGNQELVLVIVVVVLVIFTGVGVYYINKQRKGVDGSGVKNSDGSVAAVTTEPGPSEVPVPEPVVGSEPVVEP